MAAGADELFGRPDELAKIKSLISGARNGLSAALVVHGDPGIGKTALLEKATAALADVTVIRSDGFEAESGIPFAGLHRLGVALRNEMDSLSLRHRQALYVAWGIEDGPAPDPFMVGLATLALFDAAASCAPLVCLCDDAQWLDVESLAVLGFVARRLTAESVVLLFATRGADDIGVALAGIGSMHLEGLDEASSVQLLQAVLAGDTDPYVASRMAAATGGNPLALIDLARDLDVRRLTDLALSTNPVPIGRQLEEHYLRQVREMAPCEQQWLLVAAVQSAGHRELIDGAAVRLGVTPDGADGAIRRGLVTVSDVVTFRHPLVRSAVYGAAAAGQRRTVHRALAAEAAALGLVEHAAWHAAEATVGSDIAVADQLAAAALRASRRGGQVSQARLLASAAALTPPGPQRNDRLISAAEIAVAAGAAQLSVDLLDRIDATRVDAPQRGRILTTKATVASLMADRSVADQTTELLRASELLRDEPDRQQKALLQAFEMTLVAEREMQGTTLDELGRHLSGAARNGNEPFASVLAGLSALASLPYAEAVPVMRRAVDVLLALDDATLPEFGFNGIALTIALFDMPASMQYLSRLVTIARGNAALRVLGATLWARALVETERGDLVAAALNIDQIRELRRANGYSKNVVNPAYLAWTGTPKQHVEALRDHTKSMGLGGIYTSAEAALANVDLANGDYQSAFDRLRSLLDTPFLHPTFLSLAPFVEAAIRSDHPAEAVHTAHILQSMAEASPTPWLRGLDHRCQALVSADDEQAESHYRRAIELLDPAVVPIDSGRAHLLYGEWLRRAKRRRESREHLRSALTTFERMKAPAFANRARTELGATGERVEQRQKVAGVELAEREATVAKMAAGGATNAEIAESLFISAHTVDYHLRKVFQKLGISSRRQLRERFND